MQSEAGDLVENDPTFHTDVDRELFDKLPLESSSSELSSLVTLATPGVSADSNGLFHGMGDHAENSFSLDGQPITDQQSKVFLQPDSARRRAVDGGHRRRAAGRVRRQDQPGDRRDHALRTGLDHAARQHHRFLRHVWLVEPGLQLSPTAARTGATSSPANGLNTGRFLDPPEFVVFHAHGNEENVFDRFDYVFSANDALHLNAGFTRSWFQTPNSYDSQNYGVLGPDGNLVGPADQRSKILTFNIAPSWTHTINTNAVFTLVGFVRRDDVQLLPQRQSVRRSQPDPAAHRSRSSAA